MHNKVVVYFNKSQSKTAGSNYLELIVNRKIGL